MNLSLPEDVLDQMALEQAHFDAAPQAFFEAWKRGAQIAGHEWFGDGTREGLQRATSIWNGARSSLTSRCTTTAGEPRLATHRPFIPPHEGHASPFGAMSLLPFAGAAMSRISIFH